MLQWHSRRKVGKAYFKETTYWGHVTLHRKHSGVSLRQLGVHVQEVKMKVVQELGDAYKMSRDAGNWMHATIFDDNQWNANTADPAMGSEEKSDLVHFVLAFGSTALSCPSAFRQWPRNGIIRAYNKHSAATTQVEAEHGVGPVFPRAMRNLTDDEGVDEQAEEQLTTAADTQAVATDDPFPDTTKRPLTPKAEHNVGAPSQGAMEGGDPFPAMAVTQKVAKRSLEVDAKSLAADWGESSPMVEPPA